MNEVFKFLADSKVFFLATVDGENPRVRPFAFVMEFEGKLYFGTNETKPSFNQLTANPNVEICSVSSENDWIRLSGKAVFDDREETKAKAFEVAPYLAGMYGAPDAPKLKLFYISDGEAVINSLAGVKKIIKL